MRPHLEYASTVWSVLYKKDCISIKNAQRRATRMVHSIRLLNYSDRMRELGLPSLQYRRTRADLIEGFKILNGIDNCDKSQLFHTQPIQRTRGHSQKLSKRQFRRDLRRHFFSQRVIDDWNILSENVISSDSITQLKTRLNKLWKYKPTKFEPDCYSYPLAHARHYQKHLNVPYITMPLVFMPPTSKKFRRHIGFGLSITVSVSLSIRLCITLALGQ